MIQRIQTLYLFLAIAVCAVCLCLPVGRLVTDGRLVGEMYNLWIVTANGGHDFAPWALFVVLLASMPVSCFAIFAFHHRMLQSRLCIFNILILVGYYIIYAVFMFVFKGKYQADFSIGFCSVMPAIGIIFQFLARKSIIKDEKLVRAADRIR